MTTDKTTLSPEIEAAVHMAESLGWDIDPDGDGRGIAELAQIVGAAASSGRKTLADAQPGGRVRLGDRPTIEKRARELLAAQFNPEGREQFERGQAVVVTIASALNAITAALSAQPSPSGQDALTDAARRVISDIDSGDYHGGISEATYAALQAAITAQPPLGDQVDDLVESLVQVMNAQYDGLGYLPADTLGVLNMAVEALAARRPVRLALPELFAAARDFYNETVADPTVRISCESPEQRDVVTAAGERLRTALAAPLAQDVIDSQPEVK